MGGFEHKVFCWLLVANVPSDEIKYLCYSQDHAVMYFISLTFARLAACIAIFQFSFECSIESWKNRTFYFMISNARWSRSDKGGYYQFEHNNYFSTDITIPYNSSSEYGFPASTTINIYYLSNQSLTYLKQIQSERWMRILRDIYRHKMSGFYRLFQATFTGPPQSGYRQLRSHCSDDGVLQWGYSDLLVPSSSSSIQWP